MIANVIKLESFTTPVPESETPVGTFFQKDIDQARAEGIAEGLLQSEDKSAATLCEALESLGKVLEISEEQRSVIHKEAVSALIPVLSEIVDALAPALVSQRLERILKAELTRIAHLAEPMRVRLSCSKSLHEIVKIWIAETGISEIELDTNPTEGITLSHTGGNINFSQDKITTEIRRLIDEIKEEPA